MGAPIVIERAAQIIARGSVLCVRRRRQERRAEREPNRYGTALQVFHVPKRHVLLVETR
jgi:hypothetical protein